MKKEQDRRVSAITAQGFTRMQPGRGRVAHTQRRGPPDTFPRTSRPQGRGLKPPNPHQVIPLGSAPPPRGTGAPVAPGPGRDEGGRGSGRLHGGEGICASCLPPRGVRARTCAAAVPGDHGLAGERVQPGRALRLLAAGTHTRAASVRPAPARPALPATPGPFPSPAQCSLDEEDAAALADAVAPAAGQRPQPLGAQQLRRRHGPAAAPSAARRAGGAAASARAPRRQHLRRGGAAPPLAPPRGLAPPRAPRRRRGGGAC